MINVKDLSKNYKSLKAADRVCFHVDEGAVYGLVGLNGAGKTTVIKSVTGLIKSFKGDISINGMTRANTDYKKNFAFLPELFTPHHYLTGMEYISFMSSLHGKKIDNSKIEALADRLAFKRELLNKKCRTYSKGTAQKLGLIQIIAAETPVMIFDEPMSGLDPLARSQFKEVLLEVHKSGRTVFLSTHILHDIDVMCTHVGLIHEGRMLFSDVPEVLKKKHGVASLEEAFLIEIRQEETV
jgi:ABC-2 type transport system ATP-binding protein